MKENVFYYNYSTKVRELWDLNKEELKNCIKEVWQNFSCDKNIIVTLKGYEDFSFFDAVSPGKITKDFVWIHISPQSVIGLDAKGEERFYILIMTASENR